MDGRITEHLGSRDFARIARALAWLDEHWREQPALAKVAQAVGLSPAYFDRLFHDWAGVTPKAYLQTLTAGAARIELRRRRTLLDTAYAVGLSGPARLHDLIVKMDAMSPAEYAREGAGLTLRAGIAPSPFGWVLSAETDRGLCHLSFVDSEDEAAAKSLLAAQWPHAQLRWEPQTAARLATSLWNPMAPTRAPLRLLVRGSRFRLKVWHAMLALPSGDTASYTQIGQRAGIPPGSARAIGAAVGANPIAWVIPCHRVLRADGSLGGYHWGTERKRAMLAWERLRPGGP